MQTMKRLFCGLFALILTISLFSFPVSAAEKEEVDEIIASIPEDWPTQPEISAKAAIVMDADSGEILYAKNATEAMYPASTTKLMTALLTLENASLSDIVSFSASAVNIPSGSSHIGMRRNEQMVLKECLYGLLLPSANEVANALAEHIAGKQSTFVIEMNERAFQLGAVNTVFANANGLHNDNHFTCAYDLALIMQALCDNSVFVEIAGSQSYVHHADDLLNKDIPMTNTNLMIRPTSAYYNEYVICSKTGHTAEAGYNLVTYAVKDGVRLVVCVMGCEENGQYVSTQSLLDYGFNYFHAMLPAELDSSLDLENRFTDSPLAIPTPDISLLKINETDTILVPDNVTFDMLDKEMTIVGSSVILTYTYQNYPLGSVTLVDPRTQDNPSIFAEKDSSFQKTTLPSLITIDGWLIVVLAVLFVICLILLIAPSRRKY